MSYKEKITAYLKSRRRGKLANRLEREAMHDIFLYDAIEGFANADNDEQALADIDAMRQKLNKRTTNQPKKRTDIMRWVITSAAVLLVFITGYWVLNNTNKHQPTLAVVDVNKVNEAPMQPNANNNWADKKNDDETMELAGNKQKIEMSEPKTEVRAKIKNESKVFDSDNKDKLITSHTQVADEAIMAPEPHIAQSIAIQKEIMADQPTKVVERKTYNIDNSMYDSEIQLNEIVVIGYEKQAKSDKVADSKSYDVDSLMHNNALELNNAVPQKKNKVIELEPIIGMKAYRKYLQESLIYPNDAQENGIEGTVKLSFLINNIGRPYDYKIEKSLSPSCDEEAIRLLNNGSNWNPSATTPQKRVTLKIKFKL